MRNLNKYTRSLGIVTVIAASSLLISTSTFAKAQHKHIKMQFKRLDQNQDQILTLDELTTPALSRAEKRMDRIDTDEDGFISLEEMLAAKQRPDFSDIADDIVLCVNDLKIETGSERIMVPDPSVFASTEDKFAELDTSQDNLIDWPEIETAVTTKVSNKFSQADTDENAQLDRMEFLNHKLNQRATRRAVKSCIDELTDDSEF